MILRAAEPIQSAGAGTNISAICPGCRQLGTFEVLKVHGGTADDARLPDGTIIGERRCPNTECRAVLFFVWQSGRIADSFPRLCIDFDATNVPPPVVGALQEAITCHAAGCFIAAAIMVRKTLEELCRERGATGANLKERIKALGTRVVLPVDLLQGLDDLRLLGNDAAHIESREYDQVGREEVEVGIEFTKEVLKAVYQYSALLSRLRGLKKAP
jgi:Domain of unknown function (DUF4145)